MVTQSRTGQIRPPIAEKVGVSDKTVAVARRARAEHSAPAARTGKDGKSYPGRQAPRQSDQLR